MGVNKICRGTTLLLLTALVLLAGDIHPNPGPSSPAVASCEFPCTICGYSVDEDHAAICCNNCERWTHIWCSGGVSLEEYNIIVDNTDDSPWFCPACFASEHPYHQTSKLSYADTSVSTQIPPPSWNCSSSVSCLCMNARSIVNKTSELLALLGSRSFDLIAITETFLAPDISSSEIFLPEYQVFRKDCSRHGGGVLLAVRSFISTVHRTDLESNCIPELLRAELSLASGKLLVGDYRPPGGHCDELLHLHHALVCLPPSIPYLICGDFNAPGINWSLNFPTSSSTIARAVCNLVQDLHLTQLVNEPTRGNHILDLVLASTPDLTSNV